MFCLGLLFLLTHSTDQAGLCLPSADIKGVSHHHQASYPLLQAVTCLVPLNLLWGPSTLTPNSPAAEDEAGQKPGQKDLRPLWEHFAEAFWSQTKVT